MDAMDELDQVQGCMGRRVFLHAARYLCKAAQQFVVFLFSLHLELGHDFSLLWVII